MTAGDLVGGRVDHRHGIRATVRNVGVPRQGFGAAENTGHGKGRDREQPGNVKVHSIPLDPRKVVPPPRREGGKEECAWRSVTWSAVARPA